MKKLMPVLASPARLVRIGILLAALGGGAALMARASQEQKRHTIRSRTDMVTILASVTDANGRPIPALTQDAFQLSEEGVPQKLAFFESQTDRPLDLALMIDSSLSAYKELHFEGDAAGHFIQQVVRPGDMLAVFEFSETVTRLADFTDNIPALQSAVRKMTSGTGTSLYDAVVLGSHSLMRRPLGRRRAVVIVTDAGETTSVSKFEDARHAAVVSGTLLYTIVVRPVKNENGRNTAGEHALITITDSVGGAMYILDDLTQIQEMFDRINRELRTQYLLGYYPQPTPPPASDRHVHLDVKGNYVVRSRTEYETPTAD